MQQIVRRHSAGQPRLPYAPPTRPEELAPARWEIASLLMLSIISAVFLSAGGYDIINAIAPVALAAILGTANWQLARRFPAAIWTPLFGFRVAALVYFGLGGILPFFFNPETLEYSLSLYGYTEDEAAKVNLIWILASTLLIVGARLSASLAPEVKPAQPGAGADRALTLGFIFFATGFGGYLVLELPNLLGVTSLLLPGSLLALLEVLNAGGIFLISMWAFQRGGAGYAVLALLLLATTLLGLVTLTKAVVVLPMLLVSLAYLMNRFTLRRVAFIAIMMLATFTVLVPLVDHGRTSNLQKYGELGGGTVGERLSYSVGWISGERLRGSERRETINPLSRLSYFNVATYAVSRYDAAQPSDTISQAFTAIIPRVIWPDKPHTTAGNADLYYQLTGREGSALSTTVPVDVYWNFGWAGILLLAPLLGLPLMLATVRSYAIVQQRDWLMMPFAIFCFRIPLSVDGQFVNAIFAPAAMAAILYVALIAASMLLQGGRHPSPASAPAGMGRR